MGFGIKDIVIPVALSDAMSKQAQAERERQARIILGTAETEISQKFAEASEKYQNNPVARHELFVYQSCWETRLFRTKPLAVKWIRERVSDKFGIDDLTFC